MEEGTVGGVVDSGTDAFSSEEGFRPKDTAFDVVSVPAESLDDDLEAAFADEAPKENGPDFSSVDGFPKEGVDGFPKGGVDGFPKDGVAEEGEDDVAFSGTSFGRPNGVNLFPGAIAFPPSEGAFAGKPNFGVDLGVLVLSAAEVSDADAAVPSNRAANLDV